MSPTPPDSAAARSAAEVNDAIRALLSDPAGLDADRYEKLREEWVAAMRAEVEPAA